MLCSKIPPTEKISREQCYCRDCHQGGRRFDFCFVYLLFLSLFSRRLSQEEGNTCTQQTTTTTTTTTTTPSTSLDTQPRRHSPVELRPIRSQNTAVFRQRGLLAPVLPAQNRRLKQRNVI